MSGQDPRTNTNVEISNDIEDKANEKDRPIITHAQRPEIRLSKLQNKDTSAGVGEVL